MKKIKICGLSRPVDIAAVNLYKPEYCGFIIDFPKSRRNVTPKKVGYLRSMLDSDIVPVGVFVDHPAEKIAELLNENVISAAQLHGNEDEDYIKHLKTLTDKSVWKAFQIKSRDDIEKAENSTADFVLLDAGQGSGNTFDWSLLDDMTRPYALAGGLNPENVTFAMKTGAQLLDVSGGVETDGYKDPKKIKEFIDKVRNKQE